MFFLLMALASADPLITKVDVGDRAPFEGRLFNDEAVAIVLADSELAVQQCEIRKDLEWKTQLSTLQYDHDTLNAKHDSLEFKHTELIAIKDEEIDLLQRHSSPQRSMWMFLGGFTIGPASSVATYYAVNQISEN
jgi:hypothetical protein